MHPDHLKSLLAEGAPGGPARSPDCPDEINIAGFVDGGLDVAVRQQLERHLADCAHCLDLVGLLSRARDEYATAPVPPPALAQARPPLTRAPLRAWRFAPQWAAAAAIVLAVPLLVQLGRNLDRGVEGQGRPAASATRAVVPAAGELRVLVPGAGSAVNVQRTTFRWTAVSGSPYYDVRIVTDDGAVVARERVSGTTWQPPAQLSLQPGAEYFVHVDAYPSGDKAVSSDHVPFTVSD